MKLLSASAGIGVLLKGEDDERVLPIFIGAAEAQAIWLKINGIKPPRPMTHDLMCATINAMQVRLMRVVITAVWEGTFFAELCLEKDGRDILVDARPSDAIALALRCEAPIMVAPEVMDEAGRKMDVSETDAEYAQYSHSVERSDPLERLKRELDQAVKEERYEDAARLRDDIQRLSEQSGEG